MTPASSEFEGLVAAVTGGASGIGLATADLLSDRGARVAVLDLVEPPEPFDGFRCDITDRASVDQAIAAVEARFGALDVLINNAGVGAQGTVEDLDE